ncbi:uncharacterized protein B0P05DRAFT_553056 [Gilbertella persicaria]|uniref:uncharacterized protein n=1 Tax=Gilbertella persicaria TaxID=101096 RepID=UPI00221F0B7C|nr:uncharacterized protein B0P05DRAFT_553056 [Gilbertella persicaria]KAI8066974.1 hypothetical protein B0P05DRAFT_553056 [Gilbertella persicaria]
MTMSSYDYSNRFDFIKDMACTGSETTDCFTKCIINVILGIEANLTSVSIQRSEMHVQSSFMHPLIRGICKYSANVVAYCPNQLGVADGDLHLLSGRPDYRVDTYLPPLYTSKYTSLFGDVKPLSSSSREVDFLINFYKICIFMKLELRHSTTKAQLGFRQWEPLL